MRCRCCRKVRWRGAIEPGLLSARVRLLVARLALDAGPSSATCRRRSTLCCTWPFVSCVRRVRSWLIRPASHRRSANDVVPDKRCDMALLRLKRHWHVALTSLCTLGVVSGHTLSAGAPPPSRFIPRFIAAPCPFIPAADQTEGSTVDCGSWRCPRIGRARMAAGSSSPSRYSGLPKVRGGHRSSFWEGDQVRSSSQTLVRGFPARSRATSPPVAISSCSISAASVFHNRRWIARSCGT